MQVSSENIVDQKRRNLGLEKMNKSRAKVFSFRDKIMCMIKSCVFTP